MSTPPCRKARRCKFGVNTVERRRLSACSLRPLITKGGYHSSVTTRNDYTQASSEFRFCIPGILDPPAASGTGFLRHVLWTLLLCEARPLLHSTTIICMTCFERIQSCPMSSTRRQRRTPPDVQQFANSSTSYPVRKMVNQPAQSSLWSANPGLPVKKAKC